MATKIKTNVTRILTSSKLEFDIITYESKDGKIDGISVADKIGKSSLEVFKTLVARTCDKEIVVFVIPVANEINLKKAAKEIGVKKIDLIAVKELLALTGYIRGGCSPIGMKKKYRTFFDNSVENLDKIILSAGKIGIQVEINPSDLIDMLDAKKIELE
jgi:Cys-tRNA(Pro)/Cys-tRNA(Cys) deacylase